MWSIVFTFRENIFYIICPVFLWVFTFCAWKTFFNLLILYTVIHGLLDWFTRFYLLRRRLPPGPFPYPLVGNLLQIWPNRMENEKLLAMADVYGPIFTIFLPNPIVVVCEQNKMHSIVLDGRPLRASPDNAPNLLRPQFCLSAQERKTGIHVDKWTCQNPTFLRFIKDGRGPQCARLQRQTDVLLDDICILLRKSAEEIIEFDLAKHMKKAAISMETLVELAASDSLFTRLFLSQRACAENYATNRSLLAEEIKKDIEKMRLDVKNENPAESFIEKYAMLNFEPLARAPGQKYRFAEGQSDSLITVCIDVIEQTIRPLVVIIDNSMSWFLANPRVQQRLFDELQENRSKPYRDFYNRDLLRRFIHEFMRQFCENEWHNISETAQELVFEGFTLPAHSTIVNIVVKRPAHQPLEVDTSPLPKYRCMCDAIVWKILAHLYTNIVDNFIVTECKGVMNPDASAAPLCTVEYRPKKEPPIRTPSEDPTPWETGSVPIGEKVRISRQPTIFGEPIIAHLPVTDGRLSPSPKIERTKSSVSTLFNFIRRNNNGEAPIDKSKTKEKKSFLSTFLGRPRAFTQSSKYAKQQTIVEEAKGEDEVGPVSRSRAVTISSPMKPRNTLNAVRGIFGGKKKEKSTRRRRKRRPSLPLPDSIPEDSKGELLPPVLRIEYTA
uniref:Cytochrome P450 n=1 Tax=Steinernema glaseri TaxID=37863 RepID=A0A1I7Y335_9BILA